MIERLGENYSNKTSNQGVNAQGKLTPAEWNTLVNRVNALIDAANGNQSVYLTQEEYDELVANGQIDNDVEYNIYES